MAERADTVPVTVVGEDGEETTLAVPRGTTLRDALLDHGHSPYTRYTERLNCGGRGLCATCGVRVLGPDPAPDPNHWHDALADRFGYPRLSCQLAVEDPLTVRIPDKRVWGGRASE